MKEREREIGERGRERQTKRERERERGEREGQKRNFLVLARKCLKDKRNSLASMWNMKMKKSY